MIPYSLDTNDFRYLMQGGGYTTSYQFFEYLKDTFNTLIFEGNKMMSIGLHPRIIGHPGRIQGLKLFLDYINKPIYKNNVWIAKRIDIAKFWKHNYPPIFNCNYKNNKSQIKIQQTQTDTENSDNNKKYQKTLNAASPANTDKKLCKL